jgi:hypothetical protein
MKSFRFLMPSEKQTNVPREKHHTDIIADFLKKEIAEAKNFLTNLRFLLTEIRNECFAGAKNGGSPCKVAAPGVS